MALNQLAFRLRFGFRWRSCPTRNIKHRLNEHVPFSSPTTHITRGPTDPAISNNTVAASRASAQFGSFAMHPILVFRPMILRNHQQVAPISEFFEDGAKCIQTTGGQFQRREVEAVTLL